MARQTKAEQREATRQLLIQIGRELFTKNGYAHTATEEIVARAGVTRGALYHHFESKEGLFRAVLEDVQTEIGQKIEQAGAGQTDLWVILQVGCRAFLEASVEPQVRQIMLIDAPAVLGWQAWREMDARHSMRLLRELLGEMVGQGLIQTKSVDALTHLLSGAMNEAALWIAAAENPQQALVEAGDTLERLLNGLR